MLRIHIDFLRQWHPERAVVQSSWAFNWGEDASLLHTAGYLPNPAENEIHVHFIRACNSPHAGTGVTVSTWCLCCYFRSMLNYISTISRASTYAHNQVCRSTIGLCFCQRGCVLVYTHNTVIRTRGRKRAGNGVLEQRVRRLYAVNVWNR